MPPVSHALLVLCVAAWSAVERCYSLNGVEVATCVLEPAPGYSVTGECRLTPTANGTLITGRIRGLGPGTKHGLHVHQYGDTRNGCMASGSHYNPLGAVHGPPWAAPSARHVGDLGNVVGDAAGEAQLRIMDPVILVTGTGAAEDVTGHTLVVHAGEDDLGLGGHADSLTTGNAGGRAACCVITLAPLVSAAPSPAPTGLVLLPASLLYIIVARLT